MKYIDVFKMPKATKIMNRTSSITNSFVNGIEIVDKYNRRLYNCEVMGRCLIHGRQNMISVYKDADYLATYKQKQKICKENFCKL